MKLTLDELINEDDVVVESQGITVVYKTDDEIYVDSSYIDYMESKYVQEFVITGTGSQPSSC